MMNPSGPPSPPPNNFGEQYDQTAEVRHSSASFNSPSVRSSPNSDVLINPSPVFSGKTQNNLSEVNPKRTQKTFSRPEETVLPRFSESGLSEHIIAEHLREIKNHRSQLEHHLHKIDYHVAGIESFQASHSSNLTKQYSSSTAESKSVEEKVALERAAIFEYLSKLTKEQFEKIIFAFNVPNQFISQTSSQGERVAALLKWVESSTGIGLQKFVRSLDQVVHS